LKDWGPFVDSEFVIYTNEKMVNKFPLQEEDSDALSILSSGTDCGKYIAFNETCDRDSFGCFVELSMYHKHIKYLDILLKCGTYVDKEITSNMRIQNIQNSLCNQEILRKMNCLKSNLN
jgi:hypothetical protein